MVRYLLRRLAVSLLLLFGLTILAFALVRLVPGDTVTALLGLRYDDAIAAQLRQRYGLDEPLILQYIYWLGAVLQGDLGRAASGQAVTAELAAALPITLELTALSLTFALLLGLPLGTVAALHRGRATDTVVSLLAVVGLSVPGFWAGTLLVLGFSLTLGWFPSGRFVPWTEDPVANLRHLALPTVALGLAVTAVIARMTRSAVLDVLQSPYVRTALAKGVSPRRMLLRHVARPASLPVLTVAGLQFGYLLGGSIVIEQVFSLGGIGSLVVRAVGERDYALLQAAVLLFGSIFLLVNLAVDLLQAWIDPRQRLE